MNILNEIAKRTVLRVEEKKKSQPLFALRKAAE